MQTLVGIQMARILQISPVVQDFSLTFARPLCVAVLIALAAAAQAEPIAIDAPEQAEAPDWIVASESPTDVETWVREESTRTLLASAAEETRRDVLQQGFQPRPPTWIQASAQSIQGGGAGLDDAERAERDLQTLNWVIEQQQREAAARREGRRDTGEASEDDRWFRHLLPQHWIPVLKAHREWVVAGGTTLLILVWGASIFARRPSSGPVQAPEPPAKPVRRRRRHRRSSLQWQ